MTKFTVVELLAAGCSNQFAATACHFVPLTYESSEEFIERVELLMLRQEESGKIGRGAPENAGITNGQMQVEHDYNGDLLTYHGFEINRKNLRY